MTSAPGSEDLGCSRLMFLLKTTWRGRFFKKKRTVKASETYWDSQDLLRNQKSQSQENFKKVIWWCSVLLFSPPGIYLIHIAGQETMKLSREFLLKTEKTIVSWARYTKIEVWGFPSSQDWGAKVLDKKGGSKKWFFTLILPPRNLLHRLRD